MSPGATTVRSVALSAATAFLVISSSLACSSQSTNSGAGGTSGAAGAAGTGGTVGPACQGGGACVSPATTGWKGPVALYKGGNKPGCGAAYETSVFDGHAGLESQPASCDCDCAVSNVACDATVTLSFSSAAGCSEDCGTASAKISDKGCDTSFHNANTCATEVKSVTVGGTATCTASPTTNVTKPEPTWTDAVLACGSATALPAAECSGGQLCAPKLPQPLSKICIYAPDDLPCPAGDYQDRLVAYENFTDGRGCSCGCDAPKMECAGTIEAWADSIQLSTCSGTSALSTTDTSTVSCAPAGSQYEWLAVSYNATDPGKTTCPKKITPSGDVKGALPTTFCCL